MSLEIKKISTVTSVDKIKLFNETYILFHGDAIDERGNAILQVKNEYCDYKTIKFLPKSSNIEINYNKSDKETFRSFELQQYLESLEPNNILIDSTTLTIAEILLLLHAINISDSSKNLQIIYVEPIKYSGERSKLDGNNIDYKLSHNMEGFYDIRPYNSFIDSNNPEDRAEVSILLGFEEDRLGRIFEFDQNQKYKSFIPIVGLPAFNPGWENTSLIKNIRHFNNNFKNIEFAAAYNPYQTNALLEKLYKSSDTENFVIATLGTKPCAIGASVFLVNNYKKNNNNVGILYDFPIKKEKRTEGISKIFIYEFNKY